MLTTEQLRLARSLVHTARARLAAHLALPGLTVTDHGAVDVDARLEFHEDVPVVHVTPPPHLAPADHPDLRWVAQALRRRETQLTTLVTALAEAQRPYLSGARPEPVAISSFRFPGLLFVHHSIVRAALEEMTILTPRGALPLHLLAAPSDTLRGAADAVLNTAAGTLVAVTTPSGERFALALEDVPAPSVGDPISIHENALGVPSEEARAAASALGDISDVFAWQG
jgi:hypothetical protein